MRRCWEQLAIAVVVAVASCARTTAETFETPFPGEVLAASSIDGRCSDEGCYTRYRVRIMNPTDTAANVLTCSVDDSHDPELEGLRLPVGQVSGIALSPGSSVTAEASWYVPISLEAIERLAGASLSCDAIDWHGAPPV